MQQGPAKPSMDPLHMDLQDLIEDEDGIGVLGVVLIVLLLLILFGVIGFSFRG